MGFPLSAEKAGHAAARVATGSVFNAEAQRRKKKKFFFAVSAILRLCVKAHGVDGIEEVAGARMDKTETARAFGNPVQGRCRRDENGDSDPLAGGV